MKISHRIFGHRWFLVKRKGNKWVRYCPDCDIIAPDQA